MRYFLELSYLGKSYHGWQRQPNAISVQQVLEEKLSLILGQDIQVIGAGRTDTGVHAKQLFAHFDFEAELVHDFVFRLNSILPQDIAVRACFPVRKEAHARFDAVKRSYEYLISTEKDVFRLEQSYYVKQNLDLENMKLAAKILLDYRDFKCFSRTRTDVKTYHCEIYEASWEEIPGGLIFRISADRFLRNMVRAVVGTLLEVGLAKKQVQDMHHIILSRDRSNAGASAPAHGLYLTEVKYPKSILI